VKICFSPDEYGNPGDHSYQARLLRKDSGLRYVGKQHEMIPLLDQSRAIATEKIEIDHAKPADLERIRKEQDTKVQIPYFRSMVEADPENWWARHYLAVALLNDNRKSEALAEWRVIVDSGPPTASRWLPAMINVAEGLLAEGKCDEAVEICRRAFPVFMDRREPYILLGDAEKGRGNAREAIRWLNIAAHMPKPESPSLAMSGIAYSWLPFKQLAEAYLMAGDLPSARRCLDIALAYRPRDPKLLAIRGDLLALLAKRAACSAVEVR
jgi:tetratricopeptide (TPR) repeat protein